MTSFSNACHRNDRAQSFSLHSVSSLKHREIAMTCSHEDTGSGNQFGISMNYRPYNVNPAITVTDPDGNAVSGSFVSPGSVSGLLKQIQWISTSTSLPGGTYTYTVQKTGTCDLVNDCMGSIDVQVKPNIPVITINSPVRTGSTLTIGCSSSGYPTPSLTLKFDGRDVASSSSGPLANGEYSVTVSYSKTVYQGDDQKQVQCVLTHPLLNTDSTVTVTVYYGPATVSINGNTAVYADNNQYLTLTCGTSAVKPSASYQWRKDGVDMSGKIQRTLTLRPTSTDDRAVISCVASNSQYPDITANGSVTLNVLYSPTAPVIAGYNPSSFISERNSLTLKCAVQDANPTPTLRWTGCPGTDTDSNTPGTVGKNRTMAEVQRGSNMATCTCIAEQTANNNWSERTAVTITVHFGPDSLSLTASNMNMVENDQVSYTCSSTKSNPRVNFTWHKNGQAVSVSTTPVYSNTGSQNSGTFTTQTWVRRVSRDDTTLSCTTQNNRGQEVKSTINLDVKYKPSSGPVISGYNGSVMPENPNTQLQMVCTQSGGNPLPTVTLTCPLSTASTTESTTQVTASAGVPVRRNINNQKCTCISTQTSTGWKEETSIMFFVHFGPDSLTLTVNSSTLVAGHTVEFTCTSGISNPPASLTWFMDDTKISNTLLSVHSPGMFGGNTTTQKWNRELSRDDDKKVIKCQTTNTLVKTLDLNVEYGVYGTAVSLSQDETSEGDDLTVTCTGQGNPSPTYTFSRPVGTLPGVVSGNTLRISNISRTHSGRYECRAWNKHNAETVPVDITVRYPPNVSVTYNNATENAADVVITCLAAGEPQSYIFSPWTHIGSDGHTIIRQLIGQQTGGTLKLTLQSPVTYEDSGYYRCTVNNGVVGLSSHIDQTDTSGYFIVQGPPKILTKDSTVHVELGKARELVVEFHSIPRFTSVSWYNHDDGKQITGDTHTVITDINTTFHGVQVHVIGYRTSLTLSHVTESDIKHYRVEVGNTLGSVLFILTLQGITDPCAAQHILIESLTSTSVTVMWSAGCNGGSEQTFYVQYRKSSDDIWEIGIPIRENGELTYTINGLEPSTVYHIRVMSQNEKGAAYTDYTGVRTLALSEPVAEQHTGPIVGGVMGVVILVCVCSVVFVMWRKRILNKDGLCCIRRKKNPEGVYQNQEFSLDERSNIDGVYQQLGPSENPSMHYEDLGGPKPADLYVNTELH